MIKPPYLSSIIIRIVFEKSPTRNCCLPMFIVPVRLVEVLRHDIDGGVYLPQLLFHVSDFAWEVGRVRESPLSCTFGLLLWVHDPCLSTSEVGQVLSNAVLPRGVVYDRIWPISHSGLWKSVCHEILYVTSELGTQNFDLGLVLPFDAVDNWMGLGICEAWIPTLS